MRVALGLGSNMGDRETFLHRARTSICMIEGINSDSLVCSAYVHNDALLPQDAPPEWNIPFINQVITVDADISFRETPEALLHHIKQIEQQLGRIDRGHWGPREIDIDIIWMEGITYHSDMLTIPHKQAHIRDFVTAPLTEIWPEVAAILLQKNHQ